MKIGPFDPTHKPTAPAASGAPATRPAGTPEPAAPASGASAQVALSSAASALQGAAAEDFDAAKVARIAQAIRDGRFEVDAGAIADKLLAESRERLAPPAH
jgi:negative regulator of flagellin synthesis FlgM